MHNMNHELTSLDSVTLMICLHRLFLKISICGVSGPYCELLWMGCLYETFVFSLASEGAPGFIGELGYWLRSFDSKYQALWLNEASCRLEVIVQCEEPFDYTDHYASDFVSLLCLISYFQNTSGLWWFYTYFACLLELAYFLPPIPSIISNSFIDHHPIHKLHRSKWSHLEFSVCTVDLISLVAASFVLKVRYQPDLNWDWHFVIDLIQIHFWIDSDSDHIAHPVSYLNHFICIHPDSKHEVSVDAFLLIDFLFSFGLLEKLLWMDHILIWWFARMGLWCLKSSSSLSVWVFPIYFYVSQLLHLELSNTLLVGTWHSSMPNFVVLYYGWCFLSMSYF